MTVLNTETRRALRLAIDQRRRELEELPARDPDLEPGHGTVSSYRKKRCRCDHCKAAVAAAKRAQRARNPEHYRELYRAAHERRRARRQVLA